MQKGIKYILSFKGYRKYITCSRRHHCCSLEDETGPSENTGDLKQLLKCICSLTYEKYLRLV